MLPRGPMEPELATRATRPAAPQHTAPIPGPSPTLRGVPARLENQPEPPLPSASVRWRPGSGYGCSLQTPDKSHNPAQPGDA